MNKLNLSIAVGDYDRTRPLVDGQIRIDGVAPVYMTLSPEEIFFRAFRHAEFHISELSLSSFVVRTARGDCDYVGIPAFVSRAFRHTSIYIRTDRDIRSAADLAGRKVGVPEYQVTAAVWARAILQEEGVSPTEIHWLRGGQEEAGRVEKIKLDLPSDISLEEIPSDRTLSGMLAAGEIDALITPRAPTCWAEGHPDVGWLYPDPIAAATDYYRRTSIFPIMHIVGIRKDLVTVHPWLPAAVQKAFTQSKTAAMEKLSDTSATKVTMPFVEEQLQNAQRLMGKDFWSYGLEDNRKVLDAFLDQHFSESLSSRRVTVEELFHPSTHESFKV
jgi:4,5-dihydroxyphthalate decarboxylase